jgi:hypothetical protein
MVRGAEQATEFISKKQVNSCSSASSCGGSHENHLLLRQSKISIPKAGREILVGGYNVRKCLNGHPSSRESCR